jgi:hypothetical protein
MLTNQLRRTGLILVTQVVSAVAETKIDRQICEFGSKVLHYKDREASLLRLATIPVGSSIMGAMMIVGMHFTDPIKFGLRSLRFDLERETRTGAWAGTPAK